jgi:hypothetical protein
MGISFILDFSSSVQIRSLYSTRGAGMEFSFVEKRNKLTFSWMLLLLSAFFSTNACKWCGNKNVSKFANSMLNSRCLHDFVSGRPRHEWMLGGVDGFGPGQQGLVPQTKHTRFMWTKVWLEIVKGTIPSCNEFFMSVKTLFLKGPKRHYNYVSS